MISYFCLNTAVVPDFLTSKSPFLPTRKIPKSQASQNSKQPEMSKQHFHIFWPFYPPSHHRRSSVKIHYLLFTATFVLCSLFSLCFGRFVGKPEMNFWLKIVNTKMLICFFWKCTCVILPELEYVKFCGVCFL
jgi:hypothetical protein